MLVATNRNVNVNNFKNGIGDENGFGEQLNNIGPSELRFAYAEKKTSGWTLTLVEEPQELTVENLPSRKIFVTLAKACVKDKRNCVFYVHGYNKPFQETLEQAWLIQQKYGVEVVLFSWPSNTGGIPISEYRQARRIAQASFGAMDALLEKFGRYLAEWTMGLDESSLLKCQVSVNLMAHSLGTYIFENYILSQAYQAETKLFSNVVLSQADVNNNDHIKWVDRLVAGQRIYVTINENDKILSWSESLNPPRLGKTLSNLVSSKAFYFDFTLGKGVSNKHQLWGEVKNAKVTGFFQTVLNGNRGENAAGFTFNPRLNAYQIDAT